MLGDTGLGAPDDDDFQAWLDGVRKRRLLRNGPRTRAQSEPLTRAVRRGGRPGSIVSTARRDDRCVGIQLRLRQAGEAFHLRPHVILRSDMDQRVLFHELVAPPVGGGNRGASGARQAAPARSLPIWGGADPDGVPHLEPVFVIDAGPSLPRAGGVYRLSGAAEDGAELFMLNFDMPVVADAEGRGIIRVHPAGAARVGDGPRPDHDLGAGWVLHPGHGQRQPRRDRAGPAHWTGAWDLHGSATGFNSG